MRKLPDPTFVYDPADKAHHVRNKKSRKQLHDPFDPPKHKKKWKKVLGITALTALGVGLAFGAYLFFHISKITSNPFSFTQKLNGEDSGRVNILLLGVGDPGHDGEKLSDTNMVLSIDTRNNQAALISIPRDTRVAIPGHGYDKINAAHSYGDVPLARQTVENTLGIKINYYVRANFTGLKQVVDTVGGIDVDNKTLLYDPEYPCDNNQYKACGFKMLPGPQHLDGTTALKYARCRKGTCGNDFGRDARQQEVLQKVGAKALTPGSVINPAKFNSLLSSVSSNIKTDLSLANMSRLYDLSKKFDQNKTISVVFSTAPGGYLIQSQTSSDLLPEGGDFSKIQDLVQNIFKYGPIYTETPTVAIENGTTTVGLGGEVNQKITDGGYPITILAVSNALKRDVVTTQIIDFTGGKKPNTVSYLEGLLGVKATTTSTGYTNPTGADIKIIVGTDATSSTTNTNN